VAPSEVEACLAAAAAGGYEAWHAGTVHEEGGRKAVVLEPLGLEYGAETLAIR
jgi:hypothetical protein